LNKNAFRMLFSLVSQVLLLLCSITSSFSTCKSCHCWGPENFRPNSQKSARNLNLYNFCHSAKKLTAVSPFSYPLCLKVLPFFSFVLVQFNEFRLHEKKWQLQCHLPLEIRYVIHDFSPSNHQRIQVQYNLEQVHFVTLWTMIHI
jgi:hypothetical protein